MMGMSSLRRLQILNAALALFGLLDSLYLWSFKFTGQLRCTIGGCEAVNSSQYASLLGIPVAAIGTLGYATLLALALWAVAGHDHVPAWLTDARTLFIGIGLFFAAYLTAIELFVLHDICMWCVLQATAITGMTIGIVAERRIENEAEPQSAG